MSRPIGRLLVFHKLKLKIETKSEEYPIVLVQDSCSPHIRICEANMVPTCVLNLKRLTKPRL